MPNIIEFLLIAGFNKRANIISRQSQNDYTDILHTKFTDHKTISQKNYQSHTCKHFHEILQFQQ